MNNKAIIAFGFRRIWRILQISEGVIHLGLRPRWITLSSTIDLQNSSYPTQPHSIIAKYLMVAYISRRFNYVSNNAYEALLAFSLLGLQQWTYDRMMHTMIILVSLEINKLLQESVSGISTRGYEKSWNNECSRKALSINTIHQKTNILFIKGATSWCTYLEKLTPDFSSSPFAICVNLVHL